MSDTVFDHFPQGYKALASIEAVLAEGSVPAPIRELVKMRASQINGCAFCLDMHSKDARHAGETEERLYLLNAWREATVYSDAERAALALTEAITLIADAHVPADVEAQAKLFFGPEAYAALVWLIVTINAWNRLAITDHSEPGHYVPRTR